MVGAFAIAGPELLANILRAAGRYLSTSIVASSAAR